MFLGRQQQGLEFEAAECCLSRTGSCFWQREFGRTWDKTFI